MTNKYNGWTNYATWRVNLEIFDGLDPADMGWKRLDKYDMADVMKDYANELIEGDTKENTIAQSYALAFLDDVNWGEIAQSMIQAYADDETQEEEDA